MVRLLPFILIPILLIAGLGYWRFQASKPNLTTAEVSQPTEQPIPAEVPKTLPGIVPTSAPLPTNLPSSNTNALDSKIKALESTVTELKARVAALENSSPAPAAASKYPLYIPLGSGGGPWGNKGWYSLAEYQEVINADNYSGYANMQLEANFRLTQVSGTGSIRLYNLTDGAAVSPQIDTATAVFGTQTSGTFRLPSGQKTYTIQIQSTEGIDLSIQSARIKVNF